jgi:hypothetical protein
MKLHNYARIAAPLFALALGLGACSRAQHVTDAVTGPGRNGTDTQGAAGCPTLIANNINNALDFALESGAVVSIRSGRRLRIETSGDAAEVSIGSCGPCAAADIPSINFIGGHANVFVAGSNHSVTTTGQRLTFTRLAFLGTNIEPGILIANDALGNVMEIIWPELAGLGVGSPIVRVQLAVWNEAMVNASDALDVSWDLTAEQNGVQTTFKGHCEAMSKNGTPVLGAGAGSILPCPATLAGTGGALVLSAADVVQFRPSKNRLRFEAIGDVAAGTINAVGGCAASETPTVRFTGGTANVFRAGSNTSVTADGKPLAFTALASPGILIEPGIVLAADAAGDVLEIIWPGLAGLPPGAPVVRLQLARWSAWIQTGRAIDVRMTLNATGPGSAASYTISANNVVLPQAR